MQESNFHQFEDMYKNMISKFINFSTCSNIINHNVQLVTETTKTITTDVSALLNKVSETNLQQYNSIIKSMQHSPENSREKLSETISNNMQQYISNAKEIMDMATQSCRNICSNISEHINNTIQDCCTKSNNNTNNTNKKQK